MGPRRGCQLAWNTARNVAGTLSGCQKSTTPGAQSPAAGKRDGGILAKMSAGNVARVAAVLAACVAAAGGATSKSSSNQNQSEPMSGPGSQSSPPPPQQMEASRALGLWRSTFGAVKIEPDSSKGGLDSG